MVSRVSISAAAGPGPASSIGLIERRVLSRSRASGMGERPTTRATVVTNGVPRELDSPDFGHFGARLDEIWSLQAANSVCSLPRACGEGVGWGGGGLARVFVCPHPNPPAEVGCFRLRPVNKAAELR